MVNESYTTNLLTRREAERVFQLSPEPPAMGALNDYILAAKSAGDNTFFSYFLHHYEKQLNSRIYSFLQSDGSDQYDPERFLDLKLACAELYSGNCRTMTRIRALHSPPTFIRI